MRKKKRATKFLFFDSDGNPQKIDKNTNLKREYLRKKRKDRKPRPGISDL